MHFRNKFDLNQKFLIFIYQKIECDFFYHVYDIIIFILEKYFYIILSNFAFFNIL